MKKLLVGLAAVPFLACVAMAGQPTPLGDAQMDKVTAGGPEFNVFLGNTPAFELNFNVPPYGPNIQHPGTDPHTSCFGFCAPGVGGSMANSEAPFATQDFNVFLTPSGIFKVPGS
jgi:hypothetical protein